MSPVRHKILILYTGGTIGMVKDPKKDTFIPFNFQHLLDQIPEISAMECEVECDSLDHPIDSSDMKPEHWARLAKRIQKDYDRYDGFVILHGSDTMAYTASALSFMIKNLSKPVVLTGSQLPIGVPRSDARENLLTSIEIAIAKKADGSAVVPEVCVYFEYDLYRGNRTHKISAEDFEAFTSINCPPLATVGVNIKYNHSRIRASGLDPLNVHTEWCNDVGILSVFPGMTPSFVSSVLNNPEIKGFIIRSFGSGNAPTDPWFLEKIEKVVQRGIPIANISQCIGGNVELGKYEASKAMLEAGVISGSDMTLEAGLTKMMHLLAQDLSLEAFKKQYESNLRGELTDSPF
jgi:L-asparaginase